MTGDKIFNRYSRITAAAVLLISAFTYLKTIEPSASFWDCGEFIASSYKLEVGHPPGNPVFQLIARIFTLPFSGEKAAVAVNVMSAVCSALTILFLYLTIVFLAKRLVKKGDGGWTVSQMVSIIGAGAVGSLAYCFSDTFWFSAVEGEVYAMSSLFTAMVFWAMTKWYEQADEPHSGRWIVFISFLMGLSIGVHLLNLLTIPALVFLYYYRKREDRPYTPAEYLKIGLVSVVILAVLLFVLIPWIPKLAAHTDRLFVNGLGLPVNSGAAFFMAALLAGCFAGLNALYKKGKVFQTTVLLCFTTIVIGFSLFSIVIIRSRVMPPTNENQPDNAYALCRYLSREQYGSTPLLYGQYFDAPYDDLKPTSYWTLLKGKYIKAAGPVEASYSASGKMLFPRMWSNGDERFVNIYETYMNGKGRLVPGARHRKPTFSTNLYYFLDYQVGWMYLRYFMWNFAGRQNEIHSPTPGDIFYGNWECGIPLIDNIRLGDQSEAPSTLAGNKGKNHYYLLPLLLGILGLFFQFDRDRRGSWITFLLFFMTGIAIVVYLNQPPLQVRERDYAYAGSFYAFSIWIGLGVTALCSRLSGRKGSAVTSALVAVLCLGVPALMAAQNWDDHDRSNRRTAVEMARNYLNSTGKDAILITHGDNDTFPLWYAQEVEDIRPDVRVCNTSLLGTDWYIGQMRYAINSSRPLDLKIPQEQYLYGTNDFVRIYDTRGQVVPLSEVMRIFRHPLAKLRMESGASVDYIVSRKFSIPVNKENVIKYGILPEKYADMIPDQIVVSIPEDKDFISKPELFMLDLLDGYQWDRPISMLGRGGDINIGLRDYLMYEGFSARLVPIRNTIKSTDPGLVDLDDLLDKIDGKYTWEALKREDYFVDYQNLYTFLGVNSQRELFLTAAQKLLSQGDKARAEEVLDKCMECVPSRQYPLETIPIGFQANDITVIGIVEAYFDAGAKDKALKIADAYGQELLKTIKFYAGYIDYAKNDFELCRNCLFYLADVLDKAGEKEYSDSLMNAVYAMLDYSEAAEGSGGAPAAGSGQEAAGR